jgi:hypothetical protein
VITRRRLALFTLFTALVACFGADGVRHSAWRRDVEYIRWP